MNNLPFNVVVDESVPDDEIRIVSPKTPECDESGCDHTHVVVLLGTKRSGERPAVQDEEDSMSDEELAAIAAKPPHPVAVEDGRVGCPVMDWLDGTYKVRCGFGITECHKHGKFKTRPADD